MCLIKWWMQIIIMFVFNMINPDCKACPIVSRCRCFYYEGQLYYRCQSQGLTAVPSFPTTATVLLLNDNKITFITSDAFINNTDVFKIHIQNNAVKEIHEDAFKYNTNVYEILLKDNELTSLHKNVFRNLFWMQVLQLTGNNINSLPNDIFSGIRHLRFLYLDKNKIEMIPNVLFSDNLSLAEVILDDNLICTLPEDLFKNNSYLTSVSLNRNPILHLEFNLPQNHRTDFSISCMECFECGCMQALTWKWILQRNNDTDVTFSCLNGSSLTSETTVMKCSESVVAVESSKFCECSDLYFMEGSTSISTDIETDTTQNIQASDDHVQTDNPIDISSNTEAGKSFTTASTVIVSCVGAVTFVFLSVMVKIEVDFLMTKKSVTEEKLKDILIDEADVVHVIFGDDLFKEQYNNVPPRSHVYCFVVTN